MIRKSVLLLFAAISVTALSAQHYADRVDPFIGTTNYGTTNPGAVCPNGMMSVTPMNVMSYPENRYVKDSIWWSTPYEINNRIVTGFSHVNLSGVGCPDLGSLLVMPTSGELDVDILRYGSPLDNQVATAGYYAADLTRYAVKAELTATRHASVERYTFPKGRGNILVNLGFGLTDESGAVVRQVGDNEIEGSKLLGTFCYGNPDAVFPIYFVVRIDRQPNESGYWKGQPCRKGYKSTLDDNCKYKIYNRYCRELAGDNIGYYWSFDCNEGEQVEVRVGVSFTSVDNARLNLDTETDGSSFDDVRDYANGEWERVLSTFAVEGGSQKEQRAFYTAVYHTLIHPNVLNDVDGSYPAMGTGETRHTDRTRYTVFSLWDTYRTLHQFLTLFYPHLQTDMMRSMIDIYREDGWLPKWELYSQETYTMEGDPSLCVLADSYLKGLRDIDIDTAYEAMIKSATSARADNKMRPDNDSYLSLGYVPLTEQYDNSVSHALEYYVADWALAQLCDELGYKQQAKEFEQQAMRYKQYYSKESGTLRPILPDGTFYTPFDPTEGFNWQPSPGFHEGAAWNYTFAVPFDVEGLIKLNGGKKQFVSKLQNVFDYRYFDPTNEPDIIYPYLFNFVKGEEWRTQREVRNIINHSYIDGRGGLPGNEDAGTLSAWLAFSMLGFYPVCPGDMRYALVTPRFDRVVLHLDADVWSGDLVIEKIGTGDYIDKVTVDGKRLNGYFIDHSRLVNAKNIKFYVKNSY